MIVVVELLSPGLASVLFNGERQMWSLAKVRKPAHCHVCGVGIKPGERAWREATSCSMNRSLRVCEACFQRNHERKGGGR